MKISFLPCRSSSLSIRPCFLVLILFLLSGSISIGQNLDWHAPAVANPFGFNFAPQDGVAPDTTGWIKLVDIDNDGVKEAFYIRFESPYPPFPCGEACWWDVMYFENNGTDSFPDFQFSQSHPFGIPDTAYLPYAFVDMDGDQDFDIFFTRNGFEVDLTYLENTGTPESPDYSGSLQANPFGLVPPVSDSIAGDTLDNAFCSFVDIDADGDQDLFYGGIFLELLPLPPVNKMDEAYYFYRNEDTTADHSAPHFSLPIKNPFGLVPAVQGVPLIGAFMDMDCDGDFDMMTNIGTVFQYYYENIGDSANPQYEIRDTIIFMGGPRPDGLVVHFLGDWLDIGNDGDLDFIGNELGVPYLFENDVDTVLCVPEDTTTGNDKYLLLSASLTLYPNPATQTLYVDIQSDQLVGEMELSIFDLMGRQIQRQQLFALPGNSHAQFDLNALKPGIYMLRLTHGGKLLTKKFTVID